MDLSFLHILLPMLFSGLKVTALVAIVGIAIGFVLGSLSGLALIGKFLPTRIIANIYIWIIRGTPLMVQAMYVYYVIPVLLKSIHFAPSPTVSGITVIALNSGAFISEIVRGALLGIDPGQKEAGLSLGLTNTQTLWYVIIPPAFRSILPALFNQFIISVKDTALLSVILVNEITKQTSNYAALSFNTIPAYSVCALFYLTLLSILMVLQKQVERKVGK